MVTIVEHVTGGLQDALREASEVSEALVRCASLGPRDPAEEYSQYVSLVHLMIAALRRCELHGASESRLREVTADARLVHRLSPLCERLQDWPRGYPGDFQTVEYLCDGVNHAPCGTFGRAIEAYALRSAPAQQHRNKVQAQSALVARRLVATEGPLRVLSIGCGGSRDLLALERQGTDPAALRRLSVVLNDSDPDALALSSSRLARMGVQARGVAANVLAAIRQLAREGARFDLVLAGGLFDYLDDRAAAFVIRTCRRALLTQSGALFFTNIATGNPYRPWMDHIAAWRLIHRSPDDVRALAGEDADQTSASVRVDTDVSGLALLATISACRPDAPPSGP